MLKDENCSTDYTNARTLTTAEIDSLLPQIPGWQVHESNGELRLQKEYRFKNFIESMDFAYAVGRIAEEQNHHPAILTEWGKVIVTWWTHKVHGLHRNDFIMAARTDTITHSG